MRTGRATTQPDVSNGVASVDLLSRSDGEAGKVAVASRNVVSVVDHNGASVAAKIICEGDHAVRWRDHGRTDAGGDIYAGMEGAFSVKRIDAFPKRAGHLALNRPEVRSRVGADPLGRGGIPGKAE